MKIIVLGAAGMLGHQVWQKCLDAFGPQNVAGTLRKSKSHYAKFDIFNRGQIFDGIDVQNFSELQDVFKKFQPQFIINCIGLTLRKEELKEIDRCYEINSVLPKNLSLWAGNNNAKVIHYSTDCVFDGQKANYTEADVPDAKDHYGRSKYLGELNDDHSLTMRLSIVGRELENKTELLEWFLSQKGKKIKGYSRARYSGLTTNTVASETVRAIQAKEFLTGVYHVSSTPITKFELLSLANKIFNTQATIEPFEDYVSDKTLSCKLYSQKTGFTPPSWEKMLLEISQDTRVNYGV